MTACLGTGLVGVTSEMVELSGGFVILLLCVIVLIFLVKSKSLVTGIFFFAMTNQSQALRNNLEQTCFETTQYSVI